MSGRGVAVWLLAGGLTLFAQDKGSIAGQVIAAGSREPLAGVNVLVKGTYYGAATGIDGHYSIPAMTPGSYDLEASIIGYKIVLHTGVAVQPGQRSMVNFSMEETVLSIGEEVVVVGKKPLFDADETASVAKLRAEDITTKVVNSVEDILAEQIGVTTVDNEIHIRGGRIDESMFIVDGLSVKDPLSGFSGNLYVNAEAIEELEIVTGGYSAEYGQAMSGIVNVKLKEGRDHYEGSFKYSSDNWGLAQSVLPHFNTDRMEFTLGGPSLILETLLRRLGLDLPGKFSFFVNGYGKIYDSQLPVARRLYPHRNWAPPAGLSAAGADSLMRLLAPRENNDWHVLTKLTWELTAQRKLSASYDISMNINQGFFMPRAFSSTYFPYRYLRILDNYNTITREARLLNVSWVHTLSPRSFYEITVGRFLSLEHSAVQDLHWTAYQERLDLEPVNYVVLDRDGHIRVNYGDEFYDTGFAPEWYDITSDNYRLDVDWTYHTPKRHRLKTGIENSWSYLQVVDIDEPWTGITGLGKNYDLYQVKTAFGAVYIQDRISFEGMTANLGLRYDYWFPGFYYNLDTLITADGERVPPSWLTIEEAVAVSGIYDRFALDTYRAETFRIGGSRGKGRLSPRVGISHPVTDNDVLYFYYGHFSQLPTFQYVYSKLTSSSESTYQLFGNPNLNPKTTVQYELGIKHRFSEDQVLELKAYWKDMFDYETSQTISHSNPRYAHLRFNMYFNADYARARGIELILKSRFRSYWFADVNFNYSIVTGKSSTPLDNLYVQAGALDEKPLGENFTSWDRPLQFFTNLSYNNPRNWGVAIRFEYNSGRRYTRSLPDTTLYPGGIIEVDGVPYYVGTVEDDKPYFHLVRKAATNTDLKLYRSFTFGKVKYRFFLEVENLFDERIPRRINPFTGRGYDPGEIYSYSLITSPNPNLDPSRHRLSRTTQLGIQILF